MTGTSQPATPATGEASLEAWIEKQLAKPGGNGPIPRSAQTVLASVFGQPPKRSSA